MAFMPAGPSGKTLFLVCLVSYTGVQTQPGALPQPAMANSSITPHVSKQVFADRL